MDPYCPYGSLLSLWFPIVLMVPYCPYGSLWSLWFPIVLDQSCPGSILSWFPFVLDPFCPGSFLSWILFALDPFCPVLLGHGGRLYKGNIGEGHGRWNGNGKESHFQPTGQNMKKKSDQKLKKNQKWKIFGRGLTKLTLD